MVAHAVPAAHQALEWLVASKDPGVVVHPVVAPWRETGSMRLSRAVAQEGEIQQSYYKY